MGQLGERIKRFRRVGIDTNLSDALFVATAIEEKADAFVTNDIRLQKVEDIEMLVLDDFLVR